MVGVVGTVEGVVKGIPVVLAGFVVLCTVVGTLVEGVIMGDVTLEVGAVTVGTIVGVVIETVDGIVKGAPVVLAGFVVLFTVVVGTLVVGVVTTDVTVGTVVGVEEGTVGDVTETPTVLAGIVGVTVISLRLFNCMPAGNA